MTQVSWRTSGLPEPLWVEKLDKHSGIPEVVIGKLNPTIVEMFRTATRFPIDQLSAKTAWCAAAVGSALLQAGFQCTRSAAAKSYATYGVEADPQYGAIAVFAPHSADAGGTGHVGFITGVDHDSLLILGGNQSLKGVDTGSVRRKWFKKELLVACRYPTQADRIATR